MNLQSHLLLAMMIESQIKERYGVSLRSDAFIMVIFGLT